MHGSFAAALDDLVKYLHFVFIDLYNKQHLLNERLCNNKKESMAGCPEFSMHRAAACLALLVIGSLLLVRSLDGAGCNRTATNCGSSSSSCWAARGISKQSKTI